MRIRNVLSAHFETNTALTGINSDCGGLPPNHPPRIVLKYTKMDIDITKLNKANKWKTTSSEDHLNVRRPQGKTT